MERLNGLEPSTFSLGSWDSWSGHHVLLADMSGHWGTGVFLASTVPADSRGMRVFDGTDFLAQNSNGDPD